MNSNANATANAKRSSSIGPAARPEKASQNVIRLPASERGRPPPIGYFDGGWSGTPPARHSPNLHNHPLIRRAARGLPLVGYSAVGVRVFQLDHLRRFSI